MNHTLGAPNLASDGSGDGESTGLASPPYKCCWISRCVCKTYSMLGTGVLPTFLAGNLRRSRDELPGHEKRWSTFAWSFIFSLLFEQRPPSRLGGATALGPGRNTWDRSIDHCCRRKKAAGNTIEEDTHKSYGVERCEPTLAWDSGLLRSFSASLVG